MKTIIMLLGTLFLVATVHAQPSCCGGQKAASVAVGSSANSLVMEKGEFGLDLQYMHWDFRNQENIVPGNYAIANVHHMNSLGLGLHYGLLNDLTISTSLPYVFFSSDIYSFDSENQIVSNKVENHGLGDLTVSATYQLPIKHNKLPKFAVIAGMEFPTGRIEDQAGSVITSMGSGSFDPLVGLMIRKKWKNLSVLASSNYKITTANKEGLDFGDFWSNQLQANYVFQKDADSLDTKTHFLVPGIALGIGSAQLAQQRNEESPVLNTGYMRLFSTVGGTLVIGRRFVLNVLADIPVYERVTGYQNDSKFRIRTSLLILINSKK